MGAHLPIAATKLVADAAQAAGENMLDNMMPWIEQHWWLPTLLLALRMSQPMLWALSQKTKTKWDDRVVRIIAWIVGAVERRKK